MLHQKAQYAAHGVRTQVSVFSPVEQGQALIVVDQ